MYRLKWVLLLALSSIILSSQLCQASYLEHSWSRTFGGSGSDDVHSVAVVSDGGVIITGEFAGTVDFGGGPLVSTGSPNEGLPANHNLFVVKLSADGSHVWSKRFGGPDGAGGRSVTTTTDGSALVTGYFNGTVDFGGGPLVSAGSIDVFVLKLAADGSHVWSRRFGNPSMESPTGVTASPDGGAVVTGYFQGAVDFGGGPLVSAGATDIFVVKLAPDGSHVWSKRFGGTSDEIALGIAATAAGGALLSGTFSGTVDFGGGPLVNAGWGDIFVLKLSDDGGHVWSKRYGSQGTCFGSSIAATSDGGALMTGSFETSVDFGGGTLLGAGIYDIFVVKLAADGSHVWSKGFGKAGQNGGASIAETLEGGALVTGNFGSSVDFGGGLLVSAGSGDIFVVKLASDGSHVSSRRFGGEGAEYAAGIATTSDGGAIVVGNFQETLDLGSGPITSTGNSDCFVLNLVPADGNASITRITDLPNDKGGWVRVHFARSGLDFPGASVPVLSYYIWERVDDAMAQPASGVQITMVSEQSGFPKGMLAKGTRIRSESDAISRKNFPPGTWEVVGSLPAVQHADYIVTAPTAVDSSEGGIRWSVFVVTAHTVTPTVWFAGAPDSGYSADNLSPSAPSFLTAEVRENPSGFRVGLRWARVRDWDVRYYSVHRGPTQDFEPTPANRVGAVTDTVFVDISPSPTAYYKVAAVDFAGNVGLPAVSQEAVTGVPSFSGQALGLAPSGANPSQGSVALWVVIPEQGRVRLDIFGLDGRRVRRLLDGVVEGSSTRVAWNLVDDHGSRVPSGVYAARLEFAGQTVARKLIVTR